MPIKKSERDIRVELRVPKDFAEQQLREQIDKAEAFRKPGPKSGDELDSFAAKFSTWQVFTRQILDLFFEDNVLATEFARARPPSSPDLSGTPEQEFEKKRKEFDALLESKIKALQNCIDVLVHAPANSYIVSPQKCSPGREVFMVHGHDDGSKYSVAHALEQLGLKPKILHEEANIGRTLLKKFEDCSDVEGAVILLTPDDVGADKERQQKPQSQGSPKRDF